jgi:hypothetical protein
LVQITKTFPARRTILQFSQIRLTLDRTFMAVAAFVVSCLDLGPPAAGGREPAAASRGRFRRQKNDPAPVLPAGRGALEGATDGARRRGGALKQHGLGGCNPSRNRG